MLKTQTYEKMKDSGVEWLGEIPGHWSTPRFRNQFIFSKGLNITKENLQDLGVPCVNYGEVHSKYGFELNIDKHALKCVSENYLESSPKSLLNVGDFVFADTSEDIEGSGNFTQLVSRETTFAGYHTVIVRPVNEHCHRFLAYVLDSISYRNQVRKRVKGVKVYTISKRLLKDTEIWIAPLPEQKAIAEFLDKKTAQIDAAVGIKQKQIALLKERKQILIQNAVTQGLNPNAPMCDSGVEWIGKIPKHWDVKKSRDLFKFSKGLTITKENLQDEGIPCVNYGEIHSKYGFEVNPKKHPLKCVGQDYLKSNNKSLLNYGDFVFADTSEDLEGSGNFTYLNSKEAVFAGYHTVIARLIGGIKYRYVAYFLDSLAHRAQIRQRVKGVKVFSVTQSILKRTSVILPPFAEQATIITYLDTQSAKIDQAIALQQQQIGKLKEYKTTLINSAVTGKIKVVVQGAGERT